MRVLRIGKSSVSNIFLYHPYKVHELSKDKFDQITEYCEYMMDQNNRNNSIDNVIYLDDLLWILFRINIYQSIRNYSNLDPKICALYED